MFLFLHGLAMVLGFLIGGPGGSGFSHMAGGGSIVAPADSGGTMPGAQSGGQVGPNDDSGGTMPG